MADPQAGQLPLAEKVGIVVVAHSRALARAAVALASEMVPESALRVAIAAGLDEQTFGTDANAVREAIEQVDAGHGVLVLCDLGSALLSAEMALEFLDDELRERVTVSPAPLVEGLVAACVTASGGAGLAEVAAEARGALDGKRAQLGDTPAETAPAQAAPAGEQPAGAPAASATFLVTNAHGLHARPAARLVSTVRAFDARVLVRKADAQTPPVSAASLSAVATVGAREGDSIELTAWGPDARAARDAVVALAARNFDDEPATAAGRADTIGDRASGRPVGAAPGLAVGAACRLDAGRPDLPDHEPGTPGQQWARLTAAIRAARIEIDATRRHVAATAGQADAAIFDAHALLLDDSALLDDVRTRIDAGDGAAKAWDAAVERAAEALDGLADSYQRARAADVRSVADQVLRHLVGAPTGPSRAAGVVVAPDLTPAQAASLDRDTVQAIVLAGGSATSHAAILARAYGIPMVTGAGAGILDVADGAMVAVDGDRGEVVVEPDEALVASFSERMAAHEHELSRAREAATAAAVTSDGVAVSVLANVGSVADALAGAAAHADGSGLVRTEFLFTGRDQAPTRDQQEQVYRAIAEAFAGRRVVLRTLDAGADKPLPFLAQEHEVNPFLGERGVRLTLHHRELFLDQLVAMCRVARDHVVSIMVPMVATVAEVLATRELLAQACEQVGGRPESLRFGIMVEVPSVALKAAAFTPHVDFFSVGTNDLTQYALAAERGNPSVASVADGLDPGVLRLIATLCADAGAAATPVPVSVCGELAADPLATGLLIGLGVRSLSVVPPAVPMVKARVRTISAEAARTLAEQALRCSSAAEVRALATASPVQ